MSVFLFTKMKVDDSRSRVGNVQCVSKISCYKRARKLTRPLESCQKFSGFSLAHTSKDEVISTLLRKVIVTGLSRSNMFKSVSS